MPLRIPPRSFQQPPRREEHPPEAEEEVFAAHVVLDDAGEEGEAEEGDADQFEDFSEIKADHVDRPDDRLHHEGTKTRRITKDAVG